MTFFQKATLIISITFHSLDRSHRPAPKVRMASWFSFTWYIQTMEKVSVMYFTRKFNYMSMKGGGGGWINFISVSSWRMDLNQHFLNQVHHWSELSRTTKMECDVKRCVYSVVPRTPACFILLLYEDRHIETVLLICLRDGATQFATKGENEPFANQIKPKMAVFWDVVPSSLVDTNRRFRGAYCLHHQGPDRVITWPTKFGRINSSLSENSTRYLSNTIHVP
jgi:hypothetical protein